MTFTKTTFVENSSVYKVTANWLNTLQDWVLQHASQHASGGADPITPASIGALSSTIYDYLELPADSWTVYTPLSMGGNGAEVVTEKLSNGVERTYLGFGDAATQYAYRIIKMPPDWNGGNLTLQMDTESNTATAAAIKLDVAGDRLADGDTSDLALSTALVSITDTNTGAGKENQSAATSPFTVSGSGNTIRLRISRDITDAFTGDLKIFRLMLKYIRILS